MTVPKKINLDAARKQLENGPMRYAPSADERSIEEQIASLNPAERECFDNLKKRWEEKKNSDDSPPFSDAMYLRFARCSPGKHKFNEKASWKVMKRFDQRYLSLNATTLEKQLATKTLFPVPGLKSNEGHDIFYMKPARYFPKETSTQDIIDNLAYSMTTMVETKEKACKEGIGFVANLDSWTMKNFSVNYCYQFMMMLQGRVPVRVRLFLIVDPPGWFDKIWKIMKPMLASDFRKKVHMIPATQLGEFLEKGFEEYLPDDLAAGKVNTEELVSDFITYRKYVEEIQP